MTQETVLRAFEPFFTTKDKGLGSVGLATVKHLAEHGGSLDFESILGSDTTVILNCPRCKIGRNICQQKGELDGHPGFA
jgi:signal transduction histidine kinase